MDYLQLSVVSNRHEYVLTCSRAARPEGVRCYGGGMSGDLVGWAEHAARLYLASTLPQRWQHVQGVVRQAQAAAGLVDDSDLLIASAWLHDIGYAPELDRTGFHPIDGAVFLEGQDAPARLCGLVAHHSCARVEAVHRGIEIDWLDEQTPLRDALWWADMTTTPTGERTDVRSRINEVQTRYGLRHVVAQSVAEAAPELLAAAERTEGLLGQLAHR
ncbi:HD domain-containing protein [Nocardia sp. CC227C]|uniref:HD domain-containing protein n=1 Tax=Nocardia sp. CC227C TaxID=3044562 RepID=UPI00278C794B|nr:HD domain-containing protein [Nocardia sp. CC227C]